MIHNEFRFNFHKTDFFGQYWKAPETKAVIVLVHGMGEHSSRYADFVVPKLTENNYSVISFDHFGHGKTKGKRGYCPSFEAVLDSVSVVIEKAKELFPNKPIFLYGHSMGGNVVINYTLRKNPDLKGVISSSPFLGLAFTPPKWKMTIGKFLKKIIPTITLDSKLDDSKVSRINSEVEKYRKDTLIHSKVSPNYSISFIEAGDWAIKNATKLNIPIFLVHGTADGLTNYKASEEFAKKTDLVTFKTYEGGYHELHNDLCREDFMADIINWLNTHI
ncbi:MAG: lysophospholipase [Tenacibaculum sp.]|nr:lysophospholipase [Tenacibaculum sp.]